MIRHRFEWVAWIAGVIGLAGGVAGWLIDPQAFAYALLAALILAIGWPLGSLALIHVHALTGGSGDTRSASSLRSASPRWRSCFPQLFPYLSLHHCCTRGCTQTTLTDC